MNLDMQVVMTDPKKENYFYEEALKTLRTSLQGKILRRSF